MKKVFQASCTRPLHARKTRRGFTLTEIAIVLGIIGLILGAIWAAASAVYNNLRVSKASTELLQTAQAVRAMYATSLTVDSLANMSFSNPLSGAALTYIQAGVFPSDTLSTGNPTSATFVQNPWGGAIAITSATNVLANDSFEVAFDAIASNACVDFVTANTGTGRDAGLIGASFAGSGTVPTPTNATTFPIVASVAAGNTGCNVAGATTRAVGFTFKLK